MPFDLWLGFLLAALVISVTPGPGAVTSMSAGLQYGYWVALRAILGLQAALLIQLMVVAAGLNVLLATSAFVFDLVKLAGAAYLIWLGIEKWRAPIAGIDQAGVVPAPANGLFWQGLLVNLSNPKAILFIAALVPQFVDAGSPQWPQFLLIGITMCAVDILVMSGYALLVSRLRRWLRDARALRTQNRLFGGFFIIAGLLLGASSRH
ncbi:homoserine/homoserine lactone efflux protein [Candidatus Accumulibacter phosphatis]|jgi:homoserine/homoserine lactone efflux protein|uniref:Homoserine/homoserine lactone efflux protein n=1 Tax=Candidatus Accumulibacter phosphatis TaxID=327160 RepID=A0ABX1TZY6_9PROT|nr:MULTISPECIES: LysE family transporter [Candidatus Accumulibacter]NMQ29834.1 homoserine/homoserine lactone efflux protein [Candidatus Accumulibacter phosphatis]